MIDGRHDCGTGSSATPRLMNVWKPANGRFCQAGEGDHAKPKYKALGKDGGYVKMLFSGSWLSVLARYGAGVPAPGVAQPAEVLGDASGDAPGDAGAYDPSSAFGVAQPLCGAPTFSVLAWSWAIAIPAPPPTIMANTTERMIRRIMTPPTSRLRLHFQGHPDAEHASIPLRKSVQETFPDTETDGKTSRFRNPHGVDHPMEATSSWHDARCLKRFRSRQQRRCDLSRSLRMTSTLI